MSPPADARRAKAGIGRAVGLPLFFSLVLGLASVFAIPAAIHIGMSARAANRIPFFGFAFGFALGIGVYRSRNVGQAVLDAAGPLIFGVVGWCFGLLLGAVVILFGASEEFADHLPTIGFVLGLALGGVALLAKGWDLVDRVRARLRRERDKKSAE